MRRRLGAVSAILAATLFALAAPAAQAQNDPASRALGYLAARQQADGSIDHTPGETEDFILGAAAAGFDPSTLVSSGGHSAYDYLRLTLASATSSPGKTGKLVLALAAGGLDPASFGGKSLPALLQSTYDPASGAYGDGQTFSQALAILALVAAANPASPVPAAAVTHLEAVQNSDGSWNYQGVKDAAGGGDTNSTAIAIQALIAAGVSPSDSTISSALGYLQTAQLADGGFPYQNSTAYGPPASDPDSDALVLEALVATGQDPHASAWTKGGVTTIENLLSFQDQASGGFRFPGNAGPDSFTTSQVPEGLALQPLPITARYGTGAGLTTATGQAYRALRYLWDRQKPDGSLDEAVGETDDALLGMAATGLDPNTFTTCAGTSAYDYLESQGAVIGADAGKTAKTILALVAGRRDPRAFGGQDLIARLEGVEGTATGTFGDGSTFTQALSILALRASGQPVPSAAVAYLGTLQDADGSWNYQHAADAPAGDTNSTAIALMALASAGVHDRDAAALVYLHTQQLADGGFPYQNSTAYGPPASDPDSDSLVIQALVAVHQNPAAATWTKGTNTPLTNLAAMQASSGGFIFPGNQGPDAFTTSQVPAGLERMPLPRSADWKPGAALGGRSCRGSGPVSTLPPTDTVLGAPVRGGEPEPAVALVAIAASLGALMSLCVRRFSR